MNRLFVQSRFLRVLCEFSVELSVLRLGHYYALANAFRGVVDEFF